jgi:hypothetical protein
VSFVTPQAATRARRAGASADRAIAYLLASEGPTWRELVAVLGLLSAVAALAYHSHIAHGGLYSDDWAFASVIQHTHGLGAQYDQLSDVVGFRPLGVLSIIVRFSLFGDHTTWHLLAATASAVVLSLLVYALLRMLRLERLHAGAIAVLLLVVPYADATRLWATGSGANLSIGAWLLAAMVALHGLTIADPRRAKLTHAGAVGLFAVSLLLYEATYVAIVATPLLYLTRAPWRRALKLGVVDAAIASAIVAVIASNATVPHTESVSHHARLLYDGAKQILTATALPYGTPRTATVLGLLALVAASGALVAWLLPRGSQPQRDLLRWLLFAAGGLLLAVAGYVVYVGAIDYYSPQGPGLANRTNALAIIGLIVIVYSLVGVVGTLLFRGLPGARPLAAGASVLAAIFLLNGYANRLGDSAGMWDRAYAQEVSVLNAMKTALPSLPAGSTVLTFGHPVVSEDPGVPVFINTWELDGAVEVKYDDRSLGAYPALPGTRVRCERGGASLGGAGYGFHLGDRYGEIYLLDVPTRRVERLRNFRQCREQAPGFLPGPYQAPPPQPAPPPGS